MPDKNHMIIIIINTQDQIVPIYVLWKDSKVQAEFDRPGDRSPE